MSFPRYSKYRSSGVKWLGDIPEHWDIVQSRRLFIVRNEPALATDRQLTASQKHGILFQSDFVEMEGRRVVEVIKGGDSLKHVEPNDFVISMRSFQGGIEWCNLTGSISWHYVMLTPVKYVHGPFFAHLLKSSVYIQALRATTDLIRDGQELRYSHFVQVHLPIVPQAEQARIATFLDQETAKIDELVAEQRRLMALLKEKRQAVISHAVTRGLNPDAHLRPSSIEWLGDVPEHWEVIALKRIADVSTGVAKGKDNGQRAVVEVPYLRVANVQDGYLDLNEVATIEIPVEDLERYALKPGDVLMNEGGDFDKLGRGHVWDGQIDPCITQNHVFAVRPRLVSSVWLNAITGSGFAQFYFMTRSKQSTNLASISSTNLMELPVILPPEEEQTAILNFIAKQTSRFDTLTAEAQRAIDLLQERRTALISAAVTGQIDVRGFVEAEAA
jgi:type I restriction enzyme, S subunit